MKPVYAILAVMLTPAAHAADLVAAYRDAQAHDPVFAAARASFQAASEKLPQGLSGLLPTIGLSANTGYNRFNTTFRQNVPGLLGGGQHNFNSNGYTLSLSQPIFQKQTLVQYDEAKLQVAAAEAQYAFAGQELIVRVAQAYFDILLAQDNIELVAAQKAAISEQLEQAKRNFEVGTATITDTHEAQARFDLILAQEIAANSDLEIKRRALEALTSKFPGSLDPLGQKFELATPQPNSVEKWVDGALQSNLQVVGQEAALQIAEREVDRNRAGHYPSLNLVASYSQSSATGSTFFNIGSDSQSSVIGLQLNMPLYQGGYVDSKVKEALANFEKARQDLENTKRTATLNTRQAFLGVASGAAQVRALEQALVSSQSSLDSTKLGQEVGVRTGVDVLNAQQQLYSAKRDLYQARYNYLLSELKLKAAAGTLKEDDLIAINKALH